MSFRTFAFIALIVAAPSIAAAQHGDAPAALVTIAPKEAAQFSFMFGQWELEGHPAATTLAMKVHGTPKLIGSWKASRAMDGFGVDDELRLTDKSGNPLLLSHSTRFYDGTAHQWKTATIDVYRGVISSSAAEWRDNQMMVTAKGVDADGQPYLARSKFYDITPTSFKYQQDRSTDNGKSWTEGTLKISATRTAPAGAK